MVPSFGHLPALSIQCEPVRHDVAEGARPWCPTMQHGDEMNQPRLAAFHINAAMRGLRSRLHVAAHEPHG